MSEKGPRGKAVRRNPAGGKSRGKKAQRAMLYVSEPAMVDWIEEILPSVCVFLKGSEEPDAVLLYMTPALASDLAKKLTEVVQTSQGHDG